MAGANNKNKHRKMGVIGFYKRKLVFFSLIFVVAFFGMNYFKSNKFGASQTEDFFATDSFMKEVAVEVAPNGNVTIDGKKTNTKLSYLSDSDELRLVVLDNPGEYQSILKVTLILPAEISDKTKTELLAIHGVGDTDVSIYDDRTIIYEASNISSTATITIVAKMPKGVIKPTFTERARIVLLSAKNSFWVLSAIALPTITFVVMILFLFFLKKRQKIDIPDKEIPNPPMAIPPAVAGVLFNQKVGSREVAATLIDLALRGDLVILDQDRGFAFGKGRYDQRLLEYEKVLLSKIFKDKMSSSRDEIDQRISHHLYSKKISLVASGIYSLATMLGYFKVNPQKSHLKYRLLGFSFFSLSLAGFILNMFYFKDPAYLVFLWVGMMLASIIIMAMASFIPARTVIGQEVLSNWLAFKKYLSNPQKIPFSENNQEIFQKYLPYAVVLNCESAWAKRFSEHNFTIPDWFLTEKEGLGLDDFCLTLFPIVSYVGRSLVALKEPGFD